MRQRLWRFLTDEDGQDMVEYSLLIVLIGTIVIIYLTGMGLNLGGILQKVGARLELVAGQVS
jgi:Flp pilus assembly pilin Flp